MRLSILVTAICVSIVGITGNQVSKSEENANITSAGLTEIVVTAEKYEERLQDVPVPVSVVSAETLLNNNQVRFQDYFASIPALNFIPDGIGGGAVTIRGLTPVGGNPTTSFVIDDVPFGASTGQTTNVVPDLDPSDLQRIEVLRGPQGTLYGSDSLGGLIKYVTVDPSTDRLSGRVEGETNTLSNGDSHGDGYGFRGALNVPVSDTLAVRVSGFARRDPGYIDNIQTGQHDENWGNSDGAHAAAYWKPSEAFSLKLSALMQNNTVHGFPFAQVGQPIYPVSQGGQPVYGDLQQSTLPNTGTQHTIVHAYSLTAKAKVGPAAITFLSGYNENYGLASTDFTPLFGSFTLNCFAGVVVPCGSFAGFGVPGTWLSAENQTDKVTEELRVSLPLGSRMDWAIGAFYTHEHTSFVQTLTAIKSNGIPVGLVGELNLGPQIYEEYAAFTDLTVRVTDQIDVQLGGRESRYRQEFNEIDTGPYATVFEGASPAVTAPTTADASNFTYLVTPRFKITPDLMVYARAASGYRSGGPNSLAVVTQSNGKIARQFDPDTTKNYEVGIKGSLLDHALSFDMSLYYIKWANIQLSAIDPNSQLGYTGNAGNAKSQGLEISLQARPWTGMTISPWIALNDAVLTQNFPANSTQYGIDGDRLPFSARVTGSLPVQQDFRLGPQLTGFLGGTLTYVGNKLGTLEQQPPTITPRQYYGGYARTDLRLGGKTDDWGLNLYCNNVTNKRGLTNGGIGFEFSNMFSYIQPRTIGVSLSRSFN